MCRMFAQNFFAYFTLLNLRCPIPTATFQKSTRYSNLTPMCFYQLPMPPSRTHCSFNCHVIIIWFRSHSSLQYLGIIILFFASTSRSLRSFKEGLCLIFRSYTLPPHHLPFNRMPNSPPLTPGWYLTHGIDHLFRCHEENDDISLSRYSLGQSQAQSSDSLEARRRRTFSLSVWLH